MSRSSWDLVLKASMLGAAVDNSLSAAGQTLSPHAPVHGTCANRYCGETFMRRPEDSNYCKKCQRHFKRGRPDLADPYMYLACQKIIAEEQMLDSYHNSPDHQRKERERHKGLGIAPPRVTHGQMWRALLGLPPLKCDLYDVEDLK